MSCLSKLECEKMCDVIHTNVMLFVSLAEFLEGIDWFCNMGDRICEKGPYRAKANSEIKTKNAAWIIFSEI